MAWYTSIWRNENCKRFCQCSCIISHLPPILHWMFTTRKCQIHDNFNFANLRIHSSIPFLFAFQFTNIFYTAAFRLHQSQQSMEQPSWQIEGGQSECHQGSNGEENHAAGIRWKVFPSLISKYFFSRNLNISFAIMPSGLKPGGEPRSWHLLKNDTMPAFSLCDMALASPLLWLICANLRCTFSLIFCKPSSYILVDELRPLLILGQSMECTKSANLVGDAQERTICIFLVFLLPCFNHFFFHF